MLAEWKRSEALGKEREEARRAPTVYRDHATGQDLPHQHLISWNTARQRPGTVVKLSPEPSVYVAGRRDEAGVWIPDHDEAPLAEEFVIVSIENDGKLVTVKPKTQASRKKKGKTAPDD